MKIFTILALLIAIAAAVFASQNAAPVAIYLLGWSYQASMALVVLLTFSLGVLMGFLLSLPRMIYRMTKIASLKHTVVDQDRRIAELDQKLLEAGTSIPPQPHYQDSQSYAPEHIPDSL